MCMVSMIIDDGIDKIWPKQWPPYIPDNPSIPPWPNDLEPWDTIPKPVEVKPLAPEILDKINIELKRNDTMSMDEWVEYFKELIELAKEFDEETGQPECEDLMKKLMLKKLSKLYDIDLDI